MLWQWLGEMQRVSGTVEYCGRVLRGVWTIENGVPVAFEEDSVNEERYVVRDGNGALIVAYDGDVDDPCRASSDATNEERRGHTARFTKPSALRLAAAALELDYCRPIKLYRLKAKPKPKAPWEVFLCVRDDGDLDIGNGACASTNREDVANHLLHGERVVRYVLAEGEK